MGRYIDRFKRIKNIRGVTGITIKPMGDKLNIIFHHKDMKKTFYKYPPYAYIRLRVQNLGKIVNELNANVTIGEEECWDGEGNGKIGDVLWLEPKEKRKDCKGCDVLKLR